MSKNAHVWMPNEETFLPSSCGALPSEMSNELRLRRMKAACMVPQGMYVCVYGK